ncbi:unnamed protein product [Miscanthus lutarioriparius]|uniref:Pentacotripeptide-repeat region of PRORP domain-containing protein n=1 Tax=Miscanthus lutarioriparius TaxID=422564 RepID=A0A811S4K2_9POAL|nr:unnamed protein product [Miscanthus lutarioriparius]
MAPSLAALHSAAASHLPHPRRQRTAALARASSLLRLPLRRRSRWVAAECCDASRSRTSQFATGGAGTSAGGGRARRGVGIDVAAVAAALRDARTADDVESSVNAFLNHDNDGGGGGEARLLPLQQGRVEDVLRVYADVQERGLVPTAATYSTVVSAYKKAGDAFAAIEFFAMLRGRYGNGELVMGSRGDWEQEFVKFEKLTVRACYMSMRRSLVGGKNPVGEVLKVLLAMDEAGVRPERSDYERLVWACTGEEHYAIGKELYQRIREIGDGGEISLSVCNHLIWLMGKAKKWWAALEIYEDLLDKGPKPNNLSHELIMSHFNILLDAAKRRGIWRWGVRLLNKMQEKGLKPGSKEWNAVLLACSRASKASAAVDIFKKMVDEGLKPDVVSYGALLSALEKGKLYDEALRVWEHMCKVGIKPNLYAYTILVSIYIGKGNHAMVDAVLHDMLSKQIKPTVVTFNAIISACVRNNMGGNAFEWFHRMKMKGIEPNEITYQMLIEALVQDGKPRLAYAMYKKACSQGLQLPAKSYDTVLEACKAYGSVVDLTTLGPRPSKGVEPIRIENSFSSFSQFKDPPSSSHHFAGIGMYGFFGYRMAR